MNVVQPLLDLQEIDGLIRELEQEAKDLPKRRAQESARLVSVNRALEVAKEQLAHQEQQILESNKEADELKDKASQLRISLAGIDSNREYQQTVIQADNIEYQADAASQRALSLEDFIGRLKDNVADAQKKVEVEKVGIDAFIAEIDARLAEVKEKLAELRAQRAALEAKVPPRFKLYYERLRTKRWPVVVQLTSDGVCDGCHLVQPPSIAQAVKHNNNIVACTMCGRILYGDVC